MTSHFFPQLPSHRTASAAFGQLSYGAKIHVTIPAMTNGGRYWGETSGHGSYFAEIRLDPVPRFVFWSGCDCPHFCLFWSVLGQQIGGVPSSKIIPFDPLTEHWRIVRTYPVFRSYKLPVVSFLRSPPRFLNLDAWWVGMKFPIAFPRSASR